MPGEGTATSAGSVLATALIRVAAVAAFLCVSSLSGFAAEMFEGRTVTILTSGTPGGGYDAFARMLGRHLGRHLPGTPAVVVKNVPGAGGLALANRLYNTEPKDGTSIGIFQDAVAFTPLLGSARVDYDPIKFGWLGSLDRFVPIVLAWHTTSIHAYEDIKVRPMAVGASGVGSQSWTYPKFQNAFVGTKFNVINGFPGSAEVMLAVERGELDGVSSWCWTCLKSQKPDWVSGKKIRLLLQLAFEGDAELNALGIRTLTDILTTDEQRQLGAIMFGGSPLSRPFVTPPGVPADRLAVVRAAVKAAAADPQMIADGIKTGNPITYVAPEQIEAVLQQAYSTKPELVQKLRQALK
jgi:tripartite-type tricarboxylate transporter receptor subunit TctC